MDRGIICDPSDYSEKLRTSNLLLQRWEFGKKSHQPISDNVTGTLKFCTTKY